METARIDDDEDVYRRVPPTMPWLEPPDKISSANFKLDSRHGELGCSVYRKRLVTATQVLNHADAIPGSLIAQAHVGAIRALTNGRGDSLKLDVLAIDDAENPGHAEIRGPTPGKLAPAASKALRDLFTLV